MPIRWYKPNGTDSEAIKSELQTHAIEQDQQQRSKVGPNDSDARVTLTPWFILGLAHWTWTISLLITLRENQWAWYELVKWNDDDPFGIIPSGQFEPSTSARRYKFGKRRH
ncbi:hypothetical protein HZH68_005401 [Vespula germanica]|uniref:Uncharacterized protein n=1 Tax=Vespula germanica TaxID=30212 RepID=A0A834KHH8_VESGE|nr:hypothetical protein HZH68_005401 [Vespula germanica]